MPKSADGGGALTPSPFVHAETSSIIIFQVTMEYFGNGSAHGPSIRQVRREPRSLLVLLCASVGHCPSWARYSLSYLTVYLDVAERSAVVCCYTDHVV